MGVNHGRQGDKSARNRSGDANANCPSDFQKYRSYSPKHAISSEKFIFFSSPRPPGGPRSSLKPSLLDPLLRPPEFHLDLRLRYPEYVPDQTTSRWSIFYLFPKFHEIITLSYSGSKQGNKQIRVKILPRQPVAEVMNDAFNSFTTFCSTEVVTTETQHTYV